MGLSVIINGNTGDIGVKWSACDINCFMRTQILNNGSSGTGVVVNDPTQAYSNYFYHLEAGLGLIVKGTSGSPTISSKNFVFGYDRVNGEPAPTTDSSNPAKGYLAWSESLGDMYGFTVH